jgi:6-phosphofructokinase 1
MKNIAVFTSGGDSPGMNACIRAVVRASVHYNFGVMGIKRGYEGMIGGDFIPLEPGSVANIIQLGGTILKTARSADFMTPEGRAKAFENLKKNNIDGLVCIGGEGTYTGAMIFEQEYSIPSIGCPGTIDNDVAGTDATIGFDTAVNTAMEAIDKIRDTADAHNRIFFVEVMGRHSGYIGLYSGLAGGAEAILIPERHNEWQQMVDNFKYKARQKAFSIFIVSEGDEEGRAFDVAKRFQQVFPETDTRVTVLGHIQRGGSPTAADRILASRLGAHAVKALAEGKRNLAAGVVNNEVVFTPFSEAIKAAKKDIPENLWALNGIISK